MKSGEKNQKVTAMPGDMADEDEFFKYLRDCGGLL